MVLSTQQKETIFKYRDKSYICAILCQQTSDWYNLLKTITNIPLIIISTSMSIINSLNIDNNDIRFMNISINAIFALILSLINNAKLSEKQANFRSLHLRYTKLTHFIEDKITNELDNCTKEDIRKIISDYDVLSENLEYPYPGFIRKRVKKRFFGNKTLPNILNCEIVFIDNKEESPLINYLNTTTDDNKNTTILNSNYKINNDKINNDKKISVLIENNDKNILPTNNNQVLTLNDISPIINDTIKNDKKFISI
jgi:hypothetical protein